MTQTPRFALPLIAGGQAQKEVTHNEALSRIDALLGLAVESRTSTAAASPAVGEAWIVPTGAEGPWSGHAGDVALWDDAGWLFISPRDGCIAYVRAEQVFVNWSNGSWREAWPIRSLMVAGRAVLGEPLGTIVPPAGGWNVDAEARAAITNLIAALAHAGVLASG